MLRIRSNPAHDKAQGKAMVWPAFAIFVILLIGIHVLTARPGWNVVTVLLGH
jgi:predicted alpha/beta hydrolase